MANDIDEIFQGDSYGTVFSWSKPDATNPNISVDANPSTATFSVVRERTGSAVALADSDAVVSTNETTAVIPAGELIHAGNYALYLTAVFSDGTTQTRSRRFRVLRKDGLN